MNNVVPFRPANQLWENLAQNSDVELALIGALLLSNLNVALVEGRVSPAHFYSSITADLYSAIVDAVKSGGKMDCVTLNAKFKNDHRIIELGGSTFMARLIGDFLVDPSNAVGYADAIKETWAKREIQIASRMSSAYVEDGGEYNSNDVRARLDAACKALDELKGGNTKANEFSLSGVLNGIVERMNDVAMHGIVDESGVWPGSNTLAKIIGTWRRGRYYVLGARPGMGKTTVAVSWLVKSAKRGANVLFFSLEMGAEEIGERVISDIAYSDGSKFPIYYSRINRNQLKDDELERVIEAVHEFKALPFRINDKPGLTLAEIRERCAKAKIALEQRGKRLDVICIDHIGLVKASDRYKGNNVAETEEVSIGLKALSKELDCAVIALSQLSRQVEARDDKRPGLSDLRWSGAIEQDADVVMFCYRKAYHLERKKCDDLADDKARMFELEKCKNELEINIAKHRGGECKSMMFFADMGASAVRDLVQ